MVDSSYFWALGSFFGMFVVAGLGMPFPEEILMVGAGIWTASSDQYGIFRWLMLPICVAGVLIADIVLYGFGRYFGARLLTYRWMRWLMPEEKRHRIESNFHKYGISILLFGRLVPGVRAPLFLTAGSLRLSLTRFVIADGLGAILGNSILFFLGFWFGDQFREFLSRIKNKVESTQPVLIMSALLVVGLGLFILWLRKPLTEGDPKELPIIGNRIAGQLTHSDEVRMNGAKKTEEPKKEGTATQRGPETV